MHVLNRTIKRVDLDNRRQDIRDEWYFPDKFFVSCSCTWSVWVPAERDGEDLWIDHIRSTDLPSR